MRIEYYLSQLETDVRATMQEEQCGGCLGCPVATIIAAEISHRSSLQLTSAYETITGLEDLYDTLNDDEVRQSRAELAKITTPCDGYRDIKSDDSIRPAKMCNSPEFRYGRVAILAGRLLEIINK